MLCDMLSELSNSLPPTASNILSARRICSRFRTNVFHRLLALASKYLTCALDCMVATSLLSDCVGLAGTSWGPPNCMELAAAWKLCLVTSGNI